MNADSWSPLLLPLAASIPLLIVYRTRSTFEGFGFWVLGSVVMTVAGGVQALAPWLLPGWPAGPALLALLLLFYYLLYAGCSRLRGGPPGARVAWAGVCVALLLLDTWLAPHLGWTARESLASQWGFVLLLLACIYTLWTHRPPYHGPADTLLIVYMALVAGYHLWPLLGGFALAQHIGVLTPSAAPAEGDPLVVTGIKAVGFTVSQLLLLHHRLEWENRQLLREKERRVQLDNFNLMFSHSPVAMAYGAKGEPHTANAAFRELLALPGEGPIEPVLLWQHLYPDPQQRHAAQQVFWKYLENHPTPGSTLAPIEFRLPGVGKSPRSVLLTGRRIDRAVIFSLVDITRIRKLQDQLRNSEERYRLAIAASKDGIWDWTCADNRVVFAGGYLGMLGRTLRDKHNFVLDDWLELLHPDDRAERIAELRPYLERGGSDSFEFETRMRHRKGHYIWVLSRGLVVQRDAQGEPMRVVGTHTDITARKELELHLQSALDQRETLLQAAPLGVCQVVEGRLTQCNGRMQAYWAEWAVNHDRDQLRTLIPEADLARLEASAREQPSPDGRPPVMRLDRAILLADGRTGWFRLHARSISGRGLWTDGVVVVEDITEQRRMTDELLQSRDAAQTSARLAQGLLANVRHEFNTPLNAILGFTELIGMEASTPSMQAWAQHILQASRQLQRTLHDMQLLASLHAGAIDVRAAPVDLQDLCRSALALHREAALRQNLCLTCEDWSLPAWVITDEHWLRQALDRLLDNALKFTAHGRIILSAQVHDSGPDDELTLRLEVIDSGEGVPGHRQHALFDGFHPGHATDARQPRGPGLGLGLATVRRIAEALHGQAYHRPGPAGGSVFGFTARVRRCGLAQPDPHPPAG